MKELANELRHLIEILGLESIDEERLSTYSEKNLQSLIDIAKTIITGQDYLDASKKGLQAILELAISKEARDKRIEELHSLGVSRNSLAEMFKLSPSTISWIVNGKKY